MTDYKEEETKSQSAPVSNKQETEIPSSMCPKEIEPVVTKESAISAFPNVVNRALQERSFSSCTGVPGEEGEAVTKDRGRLLNGKGLLLTPASCGAFSPTLTQVRAALSPKPAWGEERLIRGAAGVPANSDEE